MKSYVIATAVAVTAHAALALVWSLYFHLLGNVGAMVSFGNDIADVPRQLLLGTVIVGLAWIVLANLFMFFVNRDSHS